ncbi:putative amino acid permease [Mycobacterium heckeshornense]|uniref:amino acid permease n=1 Tax=Mycobacterium heckeshornense TaxID=110505 RepID=UPI00194149AB|nr:amino acid permease [Mycobacterium heckeshornense]BCQ07003.1 putative amino acid permease [Mycobacterium heckeshornense]
MNVPKPGTVTADVGYQRGLSARTVQMMAIGGAIGTGLFYGAGGGIEQAGPALILAYVVGGLAIFVVMRALGELLVYRPVSGSMSEYAEEFLGRLVGFANGWTYWAVWTTTCMAEITVAGKYVRFWLPAIPEWVTALTVLAILFAANLISVRIFGEAEFWFSLIKVAAIVGIIIVGIAVLLPIPTIGPPAGPTVANLWNDGGIFPTGFSRALLSLQTVVFAYVGVELVGVTAGEAENPKVTLRKAINTLPLRIGLFYVGALLVILSVRGWRHFHSGQSPFVAVFKYIDIPAAAGIVNFILLTAALASCNAGIYSTGRMVHSLSERGEAPAALQALSSRHVPLPAIAFSALVMGLGVFVNWLSPERAFAYITSVSAIGIIFVWASILASHLVYRRQVAAGRLPASDYRLPGAPVTTVLALVFLAVVVALLSFTAHGRMAIMVGVVWLALVVLGYVVHRAEGPTH